MTLNGLILIKTTKNIVIFMNNNAFAHGLTGGTEPGGIEPNIVRHGDIGNKSSNKGKSATYFCNNNNDDNPPDLLEFRTNINSDEPVNIENLTVDIDFLHCYFNNDG